MKIVLCAVAGVAVGLGVPIFYTSLEKRDNERLEELRQLNRETLKTSGETLSDEEIESIRPARYLDRREFVDDD